MNVVVNIVEDLNKILSKNSLDCSFRIEEKDNLRENRRKTRNSINKATNSDENGDNDGDYELEANGF